MSVSKDNTNQTQQLLHYQLGRCLGEGGFGQVYEAWDTKLCRQVAIKYLKNITSGVDLLKEARLAASLQHAAFVKIHALEQDGAGQAIVMELVPGQTLRQLLESRAPGIPMVLDIVRQVAQAMQEAHAAGLIHGDLKPSNLMREPSGAVRILDFGLATQSDRDATTSLVQSDPQGTIAYMSPETLTGSPLRTGSDVYALGVILYELLTGSRPFSNLSGLGLAAALMQSNSDQWPWPETLPLSLRQLVRAMTARQVEQRIGSMQDIANQCAQLAALDPPSLSSVSLNLASLRLAAMPLATATTVPPWKQIWRKHARAVVVSVMLVLVLFAVWRSQPYWQQYTSALKPYSESQEMKQGLLALDQSERKPNLEIAAQHFNLILTHASEHAGAVASMSLVYSLSFEQDNQDPELLKKADAFAQQALKLNDLLALSHIASAKVLSMQGEAAQALGSLDRAFALDPNNQLAWRVKGEILLREKRWDETRVSAKQAMQIFPKTRVFAEQLGTVELQQADYKAAEEAFRIAVKLENDALVSNIGLANALLRQNRADDATQVLQNALKLRPGAELYGALGKLLFSRGDYVGAATAFEGAVSDKGNPQDFSAWANLADTLSWIAGRNEDAKQAYIKARSLLTSRLELNPKDAILISQSALFAAKVGDSTAALIQVKQALELAATNAEVQFRAAVTFELAGHRLEALAAVAKARHLGLAAKVIDAEPELVALRRDPNYLRP